MKQLINRDEMLFFLQRHCLKIHWNELKNKWEKSDVEAVSVLFDGFQTAFWRTVRGRPPKPVTDMISLEGRTRRKSRPLSETEGWWHTGGPRRHHILLPPFPRRSSCRVSSSKPPAVTWSHLSCCHLMLIYNSEVSRSRYPSVMRSCWRAVAYISCRCQVTATLTSDCGETRHWNSSSSRIFNHFF